MNNEIKVDEIIVKEEPKDELIGKVFTHPVYGEYEVLNDYIVDKISRHRKYKIRFKNTGAEYYKGKQHILHNNVKDYYAPGQYGECFGDPYKYGYTANYYDNLIMAKWNNIVHRLNDPNNKDYYLYGGAGVTMCKDWYCFENFYRDFINMPGYDRLLAGEKLELDKDLLQQDKPMNDRVYSPETCKLIPKENNIALMNRARQANTKVAEYYGVQKIGEKYLVKITKKGKRIVSDARFSDPYLAAVYRDYNARANYMPAMNNIPMDDALYFKALSTRSRQEPLKQLYKLVDKNN